MSYQQRRRLLEGLGSVNESGVRSRGLTLATARGAPITAPADGIVKFAGPFRDYDGVLIIDHGSGWLTLIVNAASTLHPGDHVAIGQPIGRALGPLQIELSQNGHRISLLSSQVHLKTCQRAKKAAKHAHGFER